MNDIRKLSLGIEMNKCMVYIVGQFVVQDTCVIEHIKANYQNKTIEVYVKREGEIMLWKSISMNVPYTIEYNIDFK